MYNYMKNNFFTIKSKKIALFVSLFALSTLLLVSSVTYAVQPTLTWDPISGHVGNDNGMSVSLTSTHAVYSDSKCVSVMTDGIAGEIIRLRSGRRSGPVVAVNVDYESSRNRFTIDPRTTLADGVYYAFISNNWYYKESSGANPCKSGAASTASFTINTGAPIVDSPISFGSLGRDNSWAKEGDVIVVRLSFDEDIDESQTIINYRLGDGPDSHFIFTRTSAVGSGQCKEVIDLANTYECRYVVRAGENGLFQVKITSFFDIVGNEGSGQNTYGTEGVTIDTDAPFVLGNVVDYYGSYTDSFNLFSDRITDPMLERGEIIYTKVSFSENMLQVIGTGNVSRPRISYSIGSKNRQYRIVSQSARLTSGSCKANHPTETSEYVCMYTVTPSDNGEFTVKVGTVSTDLAYNVIAEEYVHDTTLTFDTTRPDSPTDLDLITEHDRGQSDTDNLTSITKNLTIVGCAETDSVVTLYRNNREIADLEIIADGSADDHITCADTATSSFAADVDLSEGTHAITAKATDAVDQVSPSSRSLQIIVDGTVPTLESMTVTDLKKTTTVLSFSEPVFVKKALDAGDFIITDSEKEEITVERVVSSVGEDVPKDTITLTHSELSLSGDISFSYAPNREEDRRISDKAGNTLVRIDDDESFDITAFGPLRVSLHANSDTGTKGDRITSFAGAGTVSFLVERTTGSFNRGRVDLYLVGNPRPIGSQSVFRSASVTVRVQKGYFSPHQDVIDGITVFAVFVPSGGDATAPSLPFAITYDATAPRLERIEVVPELSNVITPRYIFNTNEPGTIRYEGECSSVTTDAELGDNTILFNQLREKVYNDCALYVTDVADNESIPLRVPQFEIDLTSPKVLSATLVRLEGTRTLITLSEPVYASITPDVADFSIADVRRRESVVTDIEGLAATAEDAVDSFILNHQAVDTDGAVYFSYNKGVTNVIVDKAGNELGFVSNKRAIFATFVRLTLSARDDTGNPNDGVTHFDGPSVTLNANIAAGSFATGDVITVYQEGGSETLRTYTITTAQNGTRQVAIEIPVSVFAANTEFMLRATLTRKNEEEGGRGNPLTIVYDTTAPDITIFPVLNDEAAISKEISASDNESDTVWKYAKIEGDAACDESVLSRGSLYNEFSIIVLKASDNGKRICFASTDIAGNTDYAYTPIIAGIDNKLPTVSSVALSGDRDFLKVTMSEAVYADLVPSITAFSLRKRSGSLAISSIESLPASPRAAVDTFVIRFTGEVAASDTLTLSYNSRGSAVSKYIKDPAGNALRSFSGVTVAQPPSVMLELDKDDDTGINVADRITAFEGSEVTLRIFSGSSAVFSTNDIITIYGGEDFNTVLASIVIGVDASDADGTNSFTAAIPVSLFTEGENIIAATHRPDSATEEGKRGTSLTIMYDGTAPELAEKTAIATLANDNTPAYVFTADEAGIIEYAGACDSVTTAAAEGDNTIVFNVLKDGSYTDCVLYVTDTAGNKSFGLQVTVFAIDIVTPVITVKSPNTDPAKTKVVTAADDDDKVTTWLYKVIEGYESCTEGRMASGTKTYTEEANVELVDEQDNGKRVCFASTDEAGNTDYTYSEVINGIDTTPPIITVRNPSNAYETRKVVSAEDGESTPTVWAYKVLETLVEVCDAGQMTEGTVAPYTERADIPPFTMETDINKRVCFSSTDVAGNTAYAESEAIGKIDVTAPVAVSARTTDVLRSHTEVTLSEPVYAASLPAVSDFDIVIDGIEYSATDLSGISRSSGTTAKSFTIAHPSVNHGSTVFLKYTRGSNTITDRVGNILESFTGLTITETKFVSVALHPDDDTGRDQKDGVTRFEGGDVTLVMSLGTRTFLNGDVVRLYRSGTSSPIRSYTISNDIRGAVRADGQTSFEVALPRGLFREGVTTLYTIYASSGSIDGVRGADFSVTRDSSGPVVTVNNPSANPTLHKVISAKDREDDETVWTYKKLASSDEVCNADSMVANTIVYEEDADISFAAESDNGIRICFSSEDVAGNISYALSNALVGIDTSSPVFSSIVVRNVGRTKTDVVFNEKVYAPTAPLARDFRIVVNGIERSVSGVAGLANNVAGAGTTLTLTHASISETASVTLHYTKGTNAILDVAGNSLESVVGQSVANTPFILITLDEEDDTGSAKNDGVTKFVGDEVSFIISLTNGSFSNGDIVRMYRKGRSSPLRDIVISADGGGSSIDAHGRENFEVSLPKSMFAVGTTVLFADHTPAGSAEGNRGPEFSVMHDSTAPIITIINPDAFSKKTKVVQAEDNENTITSWTYKTIESFKSCNAAAMSSGATLYTESDSLTLTDERDNGKQICFSATDLAGNTAYRTSAVLSGIDTTAPKISSALVTDVARTRTRVAFNEQIYASSSALSPNDFSIVVNGISYPINDIEDLTVSISSETAKKEFVFIHHSVSEDARITLSYTRGVHALLDVAGNALANFSGQPVSNTPFVVLDLDAGDDTGERDDDDYTRFTGSDVTITVSLTGGLFSDGDTVVLYRRSRSSLRPSVIKTILVSADLRNAVNARGSSEFVIEVPKSVFVEDGVTMLFASYTPSGGVVGVHGPELAVTYDVNAPVVVITNPTVDVAAGKAIVARDTDGSDSVTTWSYRQIESDVTCDADAMVSDTYEYDEGTELTFNSEDDNNAKVCFSVTDLAGNIAYQQSKTLVGIDTVSPGVSDALVAGADEIEVTVSEPVYSRRGPFVDDFTVFIDGVPSDVLAVEGLSRTINNADNRFTLVVADDVFEAGDVVSLSYHGSSRSHDSERIKDAIGNTLKPFDRISVLLPSTVALTLDTADDTGFDSADGYTNLGDDNDVSFTVSLSDSLFSDGDVIRVYRDGETSALAVVTVGARRGRIDARGRDSFTMDIAKRRFSKGVFTLRASYAPRLTGVEGLTGMPIVITYDTDAPVVTIAESAVGSSNTKVITATDADDTGETVWMYKQFASDAVCSVDTMTDASDYTEGGELSFTSEDDNDTKACFSVTDLAGNATYQQSGLIKDIDTTAPTVSSIEISDTEALTVTMSEPVYSTTGPDADDFVVYVNGTAEYTTAIEGLSKTLATADHSFTIVVNRTFIAGDTISVSYVGSSRNRDSELIRDKIGNTLAPFEDISVASQRNISFTLDTADDTGPDSTDGYTNFGDDSGVTFGVALTDDTFDNGDIIRIYRNEENRALKTVTVGIRPGQVRARGDTSFVFSVPKRLFTEGSFTLHASYAPRAAGEEDLVSLPFVVTYDATTPIVKVTDPIADPAVKKVVSATDAEDTGETVWMYKQLASDTVCGADTMTDASDYTEGDELSFTSEDDNDTKACFSVTDFAGNVAYRESTVLVDIDTTAPTVSSVEVSDTEALTVTMSELVYSTAGPDFDDFVVYVNGTVVYTIAIEGLPRTLATADNSFTVVIDHIFAVGDTISVSYDGSSRNRDSELVRDAIGNALAPFEGLPVASSKVAILSLDTADDTGPDSTDGYTNFGDDSGVTFGIALSNDVFDNGDVVRIYRNEETKALKTVTVGIRPGQVRARGDTSFVFSVPKRLFTEGSFTLYASYTSRQDRGDVSVGPRFAMTYDKTAATVTIVNPETELARAKIISATDTDTDTIWTYRQLASDATCDAGTMIDASDYTKGDELSFSSEDDNNTKVCFSVTDLAGNVVYKESAIIDGIDISADEITAVILSAAGYKFNAKGVHATDNKDSVTVWMYRQIGASAVCDAETMKNEAQSYTEEAVLVFAREIDNGTKICFSAEDAVGNISYGVTSLLTGIDTTAPSITVSPPVTGSVPRTKEVSAVDSDVEGETLWVYAILPVDIACAPESSDLDAVVPYTEGTQVVLDDSRDFDTKVCFTSWDTAGNISYAASAVVSAIDTVAPSIDIKVSDSVTKTTQSGKETKEEELAEPTRMKVISATDGDVADITFWMYRQIDSDTDCDAVAMAFGAEDYTEGDDLIFRSESDNGTKVCFSVRDAEENTAYLASEVIRGIDAANPAVSSAVFVNTERTRTEITLTEPVYAEGAVAASDFAIVIDRTPYTVTRITGLAYAEGARKDTFTVTHPAVSQAVSASLAYTAGTHPIVDVTGNSLKDFSDHPIVDTRFVEVSLDEMSEEDGVVRFSNDGTATLVLSLNGGASFLNGDTVRLYKRGMTDALKTMLISNGVVGAVDADGEISFTIALSEEVFDASTTFFTTYTPVGSTVGERGNPFTVIRDTDGPIVTVERLDDSPAQSKVVRATDDDTAEETIWFSKVIERDGECLGDTMIKGAKSYTEGNDLVFDEEAFNGKKVCFSSRDTTGNVSYAESMVISGIDATLPVITVDGPADGLAQSKTVRATDDDDEIVSWAYRQIAGEIGCDAATMASGTEDYLEGRLLTFDSEDDNGTKVCFTAIDGADNVSYVVSGVIDGIDRTGSSIAVTHPSDGISRSKVIRARDTDAAKETEWRYKVIRGSTVCDADEMSTRTAVYRESSGLVFRKERANGYKVCFSSTDTVGNSSYAASRVMRGIDATAPSIASAIVTERGKVTLTFDEPVLGSTAFVKGAFLLAKDTGTVLPITAVRGFSETVAAFEFTLLFKGTILAGDVLTLSYRNSGGIADRAGNRIDNVIDHEVSVPRSMTSSSRTVALPSSGGRRSSETDKVTRPISTSSVLTPDSALLYPITNLQ